MISIQVVRWDQVQTIGFLNHKSTGQIIADITAENRWFYLCLFSFSCAWSGQFDYHSNSKYTSLINTFSVDCCSNMAEDVLTYGIWQKKNIYKQHIYWWVSPESPVCLWPRMWYPKSQWCWPSSSHPILWCFTGALGWSFPSFRKSMALVANDQCLLSVQVNISI